MNSLLTQRCRIQRRSVAGDLSTDNDSLEDEMGEDRRPYQDLSTNVPCRLDVLQGLEKVTARSMGVVDQMYTLYLLKGTDVHEADLVAEVWNRDGEVVAKNVLLTDVRPIPGGDGRTHHLEASAIVYKDGVTVSWEG